MFKNIREKYLRNILSYVKLILRKLPILLNHPFFYFKEILNISKSLFRIISKFPNLEFNRIIRKINRIEFPFYFNFAPRYRSMFFGLNSVHIVNVMLKYVKKKTCFIDVGANIGYISAIGAGIVGKEGEIHSFEPVPIYFEKLAELAHLNKGFKINVNKFALGEKFDKSTIYININKNLIGANSMVSGLLNPNLIKETIEIEVRRLDDYIFEKKIDNISLIKIDVEGFELPLLKGLSRFFDANKDSLPPLIIEITPGAYPLLGCKLKDLDELMRRYNYKAYNFNERIKIDITKLNKTTDVLFKQII